MSNSLNKRDLSILIGNSLDHFDTALYGFLSSILAPLFFPNHELIIQLILSYSILATSIITRPLGAFIFGMIARIYGPIIGLSYSLIGVAITTVIIGCLPTYAQIGFIAPILLILVRVVRGIFSAGEITIAKLYILEDKTPSKSFKASYLYGTSTMIGIVMASGASWLVMSGDLTYRWRICFLCGGFTGLFGYFLRKYSSTKSDSFKKANLFKSYNISTLQTFWFNKANVFRVAITTSFGHVTYAIPFIVMNNYIPKVTNISLKTMMAFNTNLLVFDMLLIPIIGRLTQKFNPKNLILSACFALSITIIPLWHFLPNFSIWYITFVRCWIVVIGVLFLCPLNVWYKSLFQSTDRYVLIGIGDAIGSGTIGHMTPAISLSLWYFTGSQLSIALFIMIMAIVTFYTIKTARS